MTRHRRAPMWRRLFPRPTEPVTAPMPLPIPEPVVVDNPAEFVRAVQMLDAGVSAHRQPQPDRAHLDRHGPFLPASAVVPPPAMPGGA